MNCEDLMNMESIRKGMKLIAGDKGIDRTIRWIYFADCVQCLSADFNVAELDTWGRIELSLQMRV